MLTAKQKSDLKSLANTIKANYQIGKNNLSSEANIIMLDNALEAHELIKINILKTAGTDLPTMAMDLSSALHCEVVQIMGRVITLYRKNPKKQGIRLSNE